MASKTISGLVYDVTRGVTPALRFCVNEQSMNQIPSGRSTTASKTISGLDHQGGYDCSTLLCKRTINQSINKCKSATASDTISGLVNDVIRRFSQLQYVFAYTNNKSINQLQSFRSATASETIKVYWLMTSQGGYS